MGWSLLDNCNLCHSNGAKIRLVSGTWTQPEEINPKIPESINAVEQAQLIRQGIVFARERTSVHLRSQVGAARR